MLFRSVHYRMALLYKRLGDKDAEKREIALFQKLKAASDESEKKATKMERGDIGESEESERSLKDKDVVPDEK